MVGPLHEMLELSANFFRLIARQILKGAILVLLLTSHEAVMPFLGLGFKGSVVSSLERSPGFKSWS